MRRSKLLMHVDILRILARWGPMSFTHLMYEVNICSMFLERDLGLLIRHKLVKEHALRKRRKFTITGKGITTLKCFTKLNNILQMVEEAKKVPAL